MNPIHMPHFGPRGGPFWLLPAPIRTVDQALHGLSFFAPVHMLHACVQKQSLEPPLSQISSLLATQKCLWWPTKSSGTFCVYTNVDGKQKIMFSLTSIKGIRRRFANTVCKKTDVDMNKRADELTAQELDNLMTIVANPRQFKIPD